MAVPQESTNIFSGGLNSDYNKILQPKDTYISADNIRLTTYEGSNNVSLTNIKGQRTLGAIPNTSNVLKLTFPTAPSATPMPYTITIGANSISGTMIITMENIADAINNSANFSLYQAYVSNDETYILLINISGGPLSTFTVLYGATTATAFLYVAAQSNLIAIGSTYIRDDIYLITTAETAQVPATNGGIGQIWKLAYDKVTLFPTFTLLYNNYINLTTYHPIPPTAIQGRYENSNIKRIYWTDNFNQLRSFNTEGENAFALDPELLNVQLPVDPTIPILKEIGSGSLTAGMYQCAYRLKNTKSTTFFSELSNLVQIAAPSVSEGAATGGAFSTLYVGVASGTACSKSIDWEIRNIDTDFDRIEIVVFYYDTLNGSPNIVLTHDEPIPQNGIFNFTYTGNELIAKMTTTEFLNQSFSFTHCKTITAIDNQLVAGNISNTKIDFTYDARAYRFKAAKKSTVVEDSQGNQTTVTTPLYTLADTHDAINPDHDQYIYMPHSATVLGGAGPNINYQFGTYSVKCNDAPIDLSASQNSSFAHTNPSYTTGTWNLGVTDQDYPMNNINDGPKYSYLASIMRGYQRCEIYRFAIVFYDKLSRPLFARWIGDIKMPEYDHLNTSPDAIATAAGVADFRTSFMYNGHCYSQTLYVRFNVNVPQTIRQFVSGYRIVRVQREQEDKTILGAGLLCQVASDGAQFYPPSLADNDNPTASMNLSVDGRAAGQASDYNFTFDSPDFLLTPFPGHATNDKIMVTQVVAKPATQTVTDILPVSEAGGDPYRIIKYYNVSFTYRTNSGTTNSAIIDEATTIGYGNTQYTFTGFSNPFTYNNWAHTNPGNVSAAVGSRTLIMGLLQQLTSATTYGIVEGTYNRMYALYYRALTNQYGGNTYSQRSRNNYIACGSFQPLTNDNIGQQSFSQSVLGGDTFIDLYDNQKLIKNYGPSITGRPLGGATRESFSNFWVCESSHNLALRSDTSIHINKDLDVNNGSTGYGSGASLYETHDYNTVYSQENNFITYVPKPLDFTAVEEFDSRIWVSEQKENGEVADSWGVFLAANYYDAESNYGPINALITFKDKVFFFQNEGCGVVPISQRALVQTNQTNSPELQLGRADEVIQRPEYISKTIGTKHQWSVAASKNAIYFFDIKDTTPYRLTDTSLTAIDGLSDYLGRNLFGKVGEYDNALHNHAQFFRNGIITVADNLSDDVYFTFHNGQRSLLTGLYSQFSKTISFNETLNKWVSFISAAPYMYISTKELLISPDPTSQSDLYYHNEGDYATFYGTAYPTNISIISNDKPQYTKIFSNLEWQSEVLDRTSFTNTVDILADTWNSVRVYDSYQNTDTTTLTPGTNIRRAERSWRFAIPRNVLTITGTNFDIFDSNNFTPTRLHKEFIRDKWAVIDFTYDNTNNRQLIVPYITTKYLISPR